MPLNVSKKMVESQKNVQAIEAADSVDESKIAGQCAGCGDSNPEYVLDERQLCFDCYKAEKYYWAKGCAQIIHP